MKLIKKYSQGDKVFAKVRGYPPWPARVEEVIDSHTKNAKYNVFFYGTGETATCKVEELFLYHENKEKYAKHLKRKQFHQGLQQLEEELNNDKGASPALPVKNESIVEESEVENTPVVQATPAVSLDSDLETGPLVIDEGDKKKQVKRKSLATPISLDTSEPKKKRARGKGWYTAENTLKQEVGNESQGEETPGKEVVSRSGRKIKPKRFADFSSSDEFDMEDEKRQVVDEVLVQRKKYKLRWLRMEHQLLQLDAQIKSNLGLDRADADKCIQAMEEILNLAIDPLMLKKHPHIVETVKRLRRYIGNLSEWKLGDEEEVSFKQKADQIRQKADLIYNKFKTMFTIPDGQCFWQSFSSQVESFKEQTKDMSQEEIYALMSDPANPEMSVTDTTMNDSIAVNDANTTDILDQSVTPAPIVTPAK